MGNRSLRRDRRRHRRGVQAVSLDPLTGTCPTCGVGPGQSCVTVPGGTPRPPHAARRGVAREGINAEVRRYARLLRDEIEKLHPGATTRDDLTAAATAALLRFEYGESVE